MASFAECQGVGLFLFFLYFFVEDSFRVVLFCIIHHNLGLCGQGRHP